MSTASKQLLLPRPAAATAPNSLLEAGLVDELHLMVGPVVLGPDAVPAFRSPLPAGLTQQGDVRRFAGSGNVLIRCAAAGG